MSDHYELPSVNCKVICSMIMDMYAHHFIVTCHQISQGMATGPAGSDQGKNKILFLQ